MGEEKSSYMSDPYFPPLAGPTVESLTQRHQLFQIIQNSHLRWMDQTNDLNVRELHRALAEHFGVVVKQYEVLLDALQRQH
jgi:hypothetical protein